MHQLCVSEWLGIEEDTSRILRLNSPAGGWFPALQNLSWYIAYHNLPYVALSFTPHLKSISISLSLTWFTYGTPHEHLPSIASAISALPASALQLLHVDCGPRRMPWAHFKDSISSVVLRCGSSLTEFASPTALSDAAVDHLIQLPNLRTLRIKGPPPGYYTLSPPPIFPPLVELTLGKRAARGWLSLFERLESRVSLPQYTTPLSKLKGSLKSLKVEAFPDLIVDGSLTFPIRIFYNLVDLKVEVFCGSYGDDRCSFKLNNANVTELAMALPRLESFLLGNPCGENSCATTVACLVPISIHCVKLGRLEVHFNTTNIVNDLKDISADSRFQQLRSLPRCTLTRLDTYEMPLILDESGFETVVLGMAGIFPSLEYCSGYWRIWDEISDRIEEIRKHDTLQVSCWGV